MLQQETHTLAPVTPDSFSRLFASAFGARDARAMAALLCEDAEALTLTGHWVQGRKAIEAAWQADFAGTLARARLVTGRQTRRAVAPQVALLSQRFVLSGATDSAGHDLPRCAVLLQVALAETADRWSAVSASLAALSD